MRGETDDTLSTDEREFGFTTADFDAIARILREKSGISLSKSKESLVYSRLAKRLRKLNLDRFRDYLRLLSSDEGAGEMSELLSALTTNVTRFFREPHHFRDLETEVLRASLAKTDKAPRIRLWSAACSTGEEPYSIAMSVLASVPESRRRDVRILATDIDPRVLDKASLGTYPESHADQLSADQRGKYMERTSEGWQVADQARDLVHFGNLNLLEPFPMRGSFHAIFCRNVAIYFDRDVQEKVWMKLTERLEPNGRLYIGHSERVAGPALDLLEPCGITTYRRTS